jgi:hypothetical protein
LATGLEPVIRSLLTDTQIEGVKFYAYFEDYFAVGGSLRHCIVSLSQRAELSRNVQSLDEDMLVRHSVLDEGFYFGRFWPQASVCSECTRGAFGSRSTECSIGSEHTVYSVRSWAEQSGSF